MYNQVANYAFLDTGVNISIGAKAPSEYFATAKEQCFSGVIKVGTILNEEESWVNLKLNCIPQDVINMTAEDYPRFLAERRIMMAKKIKEYYYSL